MTPAATATRTPLRSVAKDSRSIGRRRWRGGVARAETSIRVGAPCVARGAEPAGSTNAASRSPVSDQRRASSAVEDRSDRDDFLRRSARRGRRSREGARRWCRCPASTTAYRNGHGVAGGTEDQAEDEGQRQRYHDGEQDRRAVAEPLPEVLRREDDAEAAGSAWSQSRRRLAGEVQEDRFQVRLLDRRPSGRSAPRWSRSQDLAAALNRVAVQQVDPVGRTTSRSLDGSSPRAPPRRPSGRRSRPSGPGRTPPTGQVSSRCVPCATRVPASMMPTRSHRAARPPPCSAWCRAPPCPAC